MKIKSIHTIKGYKSFYDFTWHRCFNGELFHNNLNILYGENGSGKSSISNIFKSITGLRDFDKYKPDTVRLKIDDKEYKYTSDSGSWDSMRSKNDIIFFDNEFVGNNIHLGHTRGTQKGQQEQDSGKMIIEFDSEAISLRSVMDELRSKKESQSEKIKQFVEDNEDRLSFKLNDVESTLYDSNKDKTDSELKDWKFSLIKRKKDIETQVKLDKDSQIKSSEITNITSLSRISYNSCLSNYNRYQSLFSFEVDKTTRALSQDDLVDKIKSNKNFFDMGIDIRKRNPHHCPFCQSDREEQKIHKILETYNKIYDENYKNNINIFFKEREALFKELTSIVDELSLIDVRSVFISLKELETKYNITNLYDTEAEKSIKEPETTKIKEFIKKISLLERPTNENVERLYDSVLNEYEEIIRFVGTINALVDDKNSIINKYKSNNTDELLRKRLNENISELDDIDLEIRFIDEKKIYSQNNKQEAKTKLDDLKSKLDEIKNDLKDSRLKYEDYCSSGAFTSVLRKIEEYLSKFNFNFQLHLSSDRKSTGVTREFPFAFKVLDSDGNERDFEDGMSEGELQVLSLCFFFAFLDIQGDKNNKILVFDDPITSLDNGNLSCLVDLINEEHSKFSQTFIFTHHKVFFKFVKKKIKKHTEYNVLRNSRLYGGSFICKAKSTSFIPRLREFENYLSNIPPGSLDMELKIVEYGQYLRYEVERYIKNNLLHWDKCTFSQQIEGIKTNKQVSNDTLDKLSNIYSFCNWTTSHVDVGDDHGLNQLKIKVKEFVEVVR